MTDRASQGRAERESVENILEIDRNFILVNNTFERFYPAKLDGNYEGYWVDVCYPAPMVTERYHFFDFDSAIGFSCDGWETRQYVDEEGEPVELDHPPDLYAHGIFIDIPIDCDTES